MFAGTACTLALRPKVHDSKKLKDAEQQLDSALPVTFMMEDRRAELMNACCIILCRYVHQLLLPEPIREAARTRRISWYGDKGAAGVCILPVSS